VARVQLHRLSLVGGHAVTLIHYEGRLSDTVLSVYADSCIVSILLLLMLVNCLYIQPP